MKIDIGNRERVNAANRSRRLLAAILGVCLFPLPFQAAVDGYNAGEKRAEYVFRAAYDLSRNDKESKLLTQQRLSKLLQSKDRIDRLAAAIANASLSSFLEHAIVVKNFCALLSDSDAAVRYVTVIEFTTCTGYGRPSKDFIPCLKEHRNDPDPEVREICRGLYAEFMKAVRTSK